MPTAPLAALERDIGARLRHAGVPGCSLAVVDRTGVRWEAVFGHADLRSARPAAAQTAYHLFSGTKLFTATAVMQLVEAGALDLDADARLYLPDLPLAAGITLRSLLSHASGLKETLRGFMAVYFPGDPEPTTAQALANYEIRSRRPPNTKVEYRNVNFAILGEIVSRVSGVPYRDYVRRRVLAPLGSTADFDVAPFEGRMATGYLRRWDPTRALIHLRLRTVLPRLYGGRLGGVIALNDYNLASPSIGGLVGPVGAFAPFLRAHLNEGAPLLSAASARAMRTLVARGKAGIMSREGVGLGWKLGRAGDHPFLNHEGNGAGFSSELRLYPDAGLGVVMLMNLSSITGTLKLAHEVCERIFASRGALPS